MGALPKDKEGADKVLTFQHFKTHTFRNLMVGGGGGGVTDVDLE